LMVVMHHAGLFERWRMPIATGVSWFRGCRGGEFAFYPDGARRASATVPVAGVARRRGGRPLPLGRHPVLRIVEGVLLRRRGRAADGRGARGRPDQAPDL